MTRDRNVAEYLSDLARESPGLPALYHPRGVLTYGELEAASRDCGAGLHSLGVAPGTRVALMVRPGPELLILAFALIRVAAVPVMIDPGIGRRNLKTCLDEAGPEVFIGVVAAQLAQRLLGWARNSIKLRVTVGRLPVGGRLTLKKVISRGRDLEFHSLDLREDQVAAIVFTSGSTGTPKGVVYTHRMFTAQAFLLRDQFGISPGEVDLATFPLFALFDPALRMTTVFPKMDFTRPGLVNPLEIVKCIKKHSVTHMFGSPALLNRVGRYGASREVVLPSIKRVLSAGAPVSPLVIRRIADMLPERSLIHTPYGATEALPVCSISHRELEELPGPECGRGVCVGRPLPGVNLAIIPISDGPIESWSEAGSVSEGEVGEIVVWGPNVSTRYFRRPEADRLAKIQSGDGIVRHRMGDLGYRDESGRVWFCGRKSHRVVTEQGTLFTVPCEGVFNQHDCVYRTALVGTGTAPHQRPVLCVELEKGLHSTGRDSLREELLALAAGHEQASQIKLILFHPSFPVDIRHNAKIFREKLAVWAEEKLA